MKGGGPFGRGNRIGSNLPISAVHTKNIKLDKFGSGYSGDFTNMTWKDIVTYMNYDIFDNDFFVVGNRLFRQNKGIRGIVSAQLAVLFCMGKELNFLSPTKETQTRPQAKYLPLSLLTTPLYADHLKSVLSLLCCFAASQFFNYYNYVPSTPAGLGITLLVLLGGR